MSAAIAVRGPATAPTRFPVVTVRDGRGERQVLYAL